MRSGAADGHLGYFHEAAFYDSDEAFVDIVAPFVQGGLAAGEPTIVACSEAGAALLRGALDCRDVVFLPGADRHTRPGPALKSYRDTFGRLASEGSAQLRVVGDIPHPGVGADWTGWRRYETAANLAYDDFPVWGLCPYDERTAPPDVVDDVRCCHGFVATADGRHSPNDRYEAPETFLASRPDPFGDLGESALSMTAPSASAARRAVTSVAGRVLDPAALDRLRLITSELVTNAVEHGRGPIELALHLDDDGATLSVHDEGPGPSNPLAGWLEPDPLRSSGRGLWIVNQLATDLRMSRVAGFEVRASVDRSG